MSQPFVLECTFLIPLHRDANLSDGLLHETDAWEWLDNELFIRFEGGTEAPGTFRGFYRDQDTGKRVNDESRQFTVALLSERLDDMRAVLREACAIFEQKCIYLSIAGQVEFIANQP